MNENGLKMWSNNDGEGERRDHEQEALFKRKCIAWAWDDNMVGMFLGG